jgi:hypothetical protein
MKQDRAGGRRKGEAGKAGHEAAQEDGAREREMIHGGACRLVAARMEDHKWADADIIQMDGDGEPYEGG